MSRSRWPVVPLGEMLTHYQEYIQSPEPKMYPKLSVKLYGKGVVLDTPVHGASLKMKRHQIAKSGQIILSEIWGKKGAIGFIPPEGDGALCTSHFFLFDVRRDKIEPEYLQVLFSTNFLQSQLDAEAKGTTGYAAVRPKTLLRAKIPLPPLSEQRRIVARIDELAAKIDELRRLQQSVLEAIEALSDSSVIKLFNTANSKRLSILNLGDVRGGIQKSSLRTPGENPIRYLTVAHVQRDHILLNDPRYFEVTPQELDRWALQPGDVLIIEGNGSADQVGRAAIFRGEIDVCVHQNHVIRIRPDRTVVNPEFLNAYLNSPLGQAEIQVRSRTTSGLQNLSIGRIKEIVVSVPPIHEQNMIVEHLGRLKEKVVLLERIRFESSTLLAYMFSSVLHGCIEANPGECEANEI